MITSKKSRAEIIEENLGLVHTCANRFRNRGVDYDDLFQAGCVGLIKSVDGFDETLGFQFSTYAVPVILGEIKRIFRDGGAVKVGRALKEKSRHAMQLREEYITRTGKEPTVNQLAELMDVSPSEMAQILNVAQPVMSLTANDEEGTKNQIDVPVDSPEDEISDRLALEHIVSKLPEKDRRLIEMRYFKGKTQTQTAEALDMTQVQVSRKEKKILAALRQMMLE